MRKNLFVLFFGVMFMMGGMEGWANYTVECVTVEDQNPVGPLHKDVSHPKLTQSEKNQFRIECKATYRDDCGKNGNNTCDPFLLKK